MSTTSNPTPTTPAPSALEAMRAAAHLLETMAHAPDKKLRELAACSAERIALRAAIDAEAERDKLRRQAARAIMDHLRRARAACAVDPYSPDVIAWAEMESAR